MFCKNERIYIAKNNIAFDLNDYRIYSIEEGSNIESIKKDILKNRKSVVKKRKFESVKIHVSNTCNLKCSYCYASYGNYGTEECLMDISVASDIVEFIKRLKDIKYVTFFGGEPFLAVDIIEYICRELEEKHVEFLLQTNGTILNEKILEILQKYKIKITISLDGMKEINDYNRKFKSNRGTYDEIVKNIEIINKKLPNALQAIQGTLSKEFFSYNKYEIINFLHKLTKAPIIKLECDININTINNKKKINEEIIIFFETLIHQKYIIEGYPYHFFRTFLGGIYNEYLCSAGNSISITTKGEIFPCQFYFNDKSHYMGSIIKNKNIQIDRKSIEDIKKENCPRCQECIANCSCEFCVANWNEKVCDYNKIFTECFLEIFSNYIEKGEFLQIYNAYKEIILRLEEKL